MSNEPINDGIDRKLTTILASDVVGYSSMMSADEEGTLKTLRAYRKIIDTLIKKHGGRIFNTAGDAVLAEFGSAVEGVRCAISFQEEIAARNSQLPVDKQLRFRIGMNIGDVMIEGDDLFGDGVNVAARLEGLAEPGGICISSSTFEQVKNKLSIGFQDMGPQQVKNIPHPVGAFQLTSGNVSVSSGDGKAETIKPDRKSASVVIVILAFVLLSGGIYIYWLSTSSEEVLEPASPAIFSTNSMEADEIQKLMPGIIIQGHSLKSGRPFTIRFMSGGLAEVEIFLNDDMQEVFKKDTGKWWTENNRFCMQFPVFAQGERKCPVIHSQAGGLYATRPNGDRISHWTLSQP